MQINWMVVVVGATLAALRADAQTCIPLTAEVAPWRPGLLNTQIDIYNNSCYETEVYSHYLYSQGAAADLVALGDLLNPINASANITIPQDIWWPQFSTGSAGEFRAPNQDCLRYTGDCNCPNTSASQPNEITCWCAAPVTNQHSTFPTFSNLTTQHHTVFFTELHIDRNLDRTTDHLFRGSLDEMPNWDPTISYPTLPTSPVRGKFMWNSVLQLAYEDYFQNGGADFNDYYALLEFRTCFPERFPEALRDPQEVVCHNPCNNNPCQDGDTNKRHTERWGVNVSIDPRRSEIEYERAGRMLRVTVIGYEDYLTPNRDIAVCPVLNFSWPRARLAAETNDLTTSMDYDSSACAGDDIKSGLPICGNTFLSRNVLPVSLRQEETAAPSCTNSSIISDIHKTEPANKCGPDLFFVHYELPLESLDAQITDASLRYSGMSDQDIRDAVDSADIYLFYDIQTPDFQCPSGVNALLGSVSPSVARVTKTTLKRGDLSLVVGTN